MRPRLTAALIARDEARHLPGCLASLRDVADEVVVVDTGSLDATPEIARAAGARVLSHRWTGDFAQARNVALAHTTGEWVLYVDADERLRPIEAGALDDLLSDRDAMAYRVLLRPLTGWTPYREYRLWRNHPGIRFAGVMHEKVASAIHATAVAERRSVRRCDLCLDHVGYDGDQRHKHERNLPLLQAQLAAEPENLYNWRHLGAVLLGLGRDAEGEAALRRAVELDRTQRAASVHGGTAYADLVRLLRGRGEDASALLAEGCARHPENWLLVWLDAEASAAAGRVHAALALADRLVDVEPDTLADSGVAYDARIFGADAHALRGWCLFRLGRYAEAARAYAEAERFAPGDAEPRVKRLLAEARAARAARA